MRIGWLVFCGGIFAAWGQTPSSPVTPYPPPGPPRVEEKPRKLRRIRLGQDQEYACTDPAVFWICPTIPSEQQLRVYQQRVMANPDDVCARGELIVHLPVDMADRLTPSRSDHLLWMIQNHPEWDGFAANPNRGLANPHSERERENYVLLKEAWLKQVGPTQNSGIVLHNGALFFAPKQPELADPELAVELLKRAIALDPHELVFVERLGMLYSYVLRSVSCPGRRTDYPEISKVLVSEARDNLRRSNDWILLAGALTGGLVDVCDPEEPDIYERLKEVRPGDAPWSIVEKLPSRTSIWCRSKCVPPPPETVR